MGFLSGGSKSKSQSQSQQSSFNQAYPWIVNNYAPQAQTGINAMHQFENLLGLNGSSGQNAAFDNYRNSTGYDFTLGEGSRAITNNAAARGQLGSGATLKALNKYGQGVANQYYGDYLKQLLSLIDAGNTAGNLIAGSGNVSSGASSSSSSSSSSQGFKDLIGKGLSLIPGMG